jgi:hypothetical protein
VPPVPAASPTGSREDRANVQQFIAFAFLAIVDPVLIGAAAVMLLQPNPKRLMTGFVLGALLTSIPIGLGIVFSLQGTAPVSTTKHTVDPGVDIALGGILLVFSMALATGLWERLRERLRERKGARKDEGPSRLQQALAKGDPRLTFAAGAVYEALPGVYSLGALDGIVRLNPPTAPTVLLVVLVSVMQLTFVLAPLITFTVAPDWTPRILRRVKAWFTRDANKIAAAGTAIAGVLLLTKALITLPN